MEMEKMMGCQIPAFGVWNYCHDLSITQYFDAAMQARLMKRWNWNHHHNRGGEQQQLAVFRSYSFSRRKPAQIKVIRREVDKQHDCNGGGVQAQQLRACFPPSEKEVGACTVKRKVVVSKPVDEDLYKVPQPLLYQKPKKMRKVVWSMWIGCLGLDCIA